MGSYVLKRILYMIPTLLVISVITFIIIQLPPGDYLTSYIATLEQSGAMVSEAEIASLRRQYGLDQPMVVQYLQWMWKLLHGDFGMSFQWNRPVRTLIGERLGLTMVISTATLVFTWVVAIPIGIYSAMRQYSLGDYVATVIGMLGVAVPNFLLALVIMYFAYTRFGLNITGLFSRDGGRPVERRQVCGHAQAYLGTCYCGGHGRYGPINPHYAPVSSMSLVNPMLRLPGPRVYRKGA